MDDARDGSGESTPHRIRRVRFELEGGDEAQLLRARSRITAGAESWIPAVLDAALTSFDRPEQTIRLDRLTIDLGVVEEADLSPARLREALRTSLAEQLSAVGDAPIQRLEVEQDRLESRTFSDAFCGLLESGSIPWWSPCATLQAFEAAVHRMTVDALREFARAIAPALRSPRAARRLILQLPAPLARAIAVALPNAQDALAPIDVWRAAVSQAAAEPRSPELDRIVSAVVVAAGGTDLGGEGTAGGEAAADRGESVTTSPDRALASGLAEDDRSETTETIAVDAAGLVIVHPFLSALFRTRGLFEDGAFRGEAAQLRALRLIAALALGRDAEPTEPTLVVPKLLAGWPLDEPLPRAVPLSGADLDEGESMLDALIEHWAVLGRASADALRETFLTRPGRLSASPNGWHLEVERRGTDVLLERLPWPLGVIRLPWMPRPLWVDWI